MPLGREEIGMRSDPFAALRTPGGTFPLVDRGGYFESEDGRKFRTEDGILRVLEDVDPLLARELHAQALAVDDYLDPKLLMPSYERNFVARLAVDELLPKELKQGTAILDAGCGIGILGRYYPGLNLVGVDASIDLLRKATSGYRMRVEANAEHLPFRDAAFDVILALNMLHHVIQPEAAVREFFRVLRPNGLLIVVDPRKVGWLEFAKGVLRKNDATFAETHRAFGASEYRDLLEANGLFRIDVEKQLGLVGLIGMAGLDAIRVSKYLPSTDKTVNAFVHVDEALFKVPPLRQLGLNLAVRAIKIPPR